MTKKPTNKMRSLSLLLHFYQPVNQQEDILDRIFHECYLPVSRILTKSPKKIAINIAGSLLEQLDNKKYGEFISNIKQAADSGSIELVSSAMYHTILPLTDPHEVKRQIDLHNEISTRVFGSSYTPKGFFSPEMAVDESLVSILVNNYDTLTWLAIPKTCVLNEDINNHLFYLKKFPNLNLIARDKRTSSLILSGQVKSAAELVSQTKDLSQSKVSFCVMDAETFGHHRIGHERLLEDLLNSLDTVNIVSPTVIVTSDIQLKAIELFPSTWTNSEQDAYLGNEDNSFILWNDPTNPIHKLQWQLSELVTQIVNSYKHKDTTEWKMARHKLDYALASDQYWWASAKPWWSLEMIELGAHELKEVVEKLDIPSTKKQQVTDLYYKILDKAFEWQRTGYVRKQHLKNSSTHNKKPLKDRTHYEWYNQLILEFEDHMNLAAQNKNFEQAIKWRDALYKLELGTDVYDVLHVVDELWSARNIPQLKPFFEHDPEEFSNFARERMKGFEETDDLNEFKKQFFAWKSSKEARQS